MPTTPRLLAAIAFALMGYSFADAGDWPQFLGPNRDGVSPETGLRTTWPKDGPPVVWEREVGEGYSGPVVAGGKLILFHRVGDEEVTECLDAATGKPRWKSTQATMYRDPFNKGDGPRSTPVIHGGRVYTLGAAGSLTCFDLDSGRKIWQRDMARDYRLRRSFFGVGGTPIIEGDLLVLNVGAKDAGIVAFNKDTGKEVWKATDHDASYASPVAATIDQTRHLLFFTREGLVSLDPANGAVRFSKPWRARIDASVNAATPLVIGNLVFISSSYRTGAILLRVKKDGVEEVWTSDDVLSCHFNTPIVHDGHLYGIDGRQEERARLRCVDLMTGKIRWTKEGFGCASILSVGNQLIILTEDGDLVLAEANPEKCAEIGRVSKLKGTVRAHPALADGRLYARDGSKLICWDLRK
jgi:outer membrane protein assembly factor BamB